MVAVFSMQCNLCESSTLKLLFKGNIENRVINRFSQYAFFGDIYRCKQCGLVQQKPEHDTNQIAGLLKEEKYLDEEIGKLNIEEKGNEFRRHLQYMQQFCSIDNAAIFDIGANTGVFLNECLQFTRNLIGIEPSEEACNACKERGFNVHCTLLENAPVAEGTYDIATMWDVVEHLYNPKHDLQVVLKKIKPGGKLFISTHDIDGLFARLTGKRYPMLMYQHFFHFSPKTLKTMLENCGFKVMGCKHFCKSWSVGYLHQLLHKLWPKNKLIKMISAMTGHVVNMRPIKSIRITVPIPNFFIMIAERPQ
jgi:2-polyprenyl-3-methyl-5-hydroxy-6-metoxy-1,4-benzoquinol methylase